MLLCGPVVRLGCPKNSTTPTPKTKLARSGVRRSSTRSGKLSRSQDTNIVIQVVGMCAREKRNNEIMSHLQLI